MVVSVVWNGKDIEIKQWLDALGFSKTSENNYEIDINGNKIFVNADAIANNVTYPKGLKIGRKTTTNFSQAENFVVLDAVITLLNQGYRPENIEVEKAYRLGHDEKSGNADVTVSDNQGHPFLILEAKTWGKEFDKYWKETLLNGGQLFSYERQDNAAEVLVMYASHVADGKVERRYNAIVLQDNHEYLDTLGGVAGYSDATGGNDKFETWQDVYDSSYVSRGVLESNIDLFTVATPKMSVNDLIEISHDEVQKKYNQFAKILRKFNVGGRENAFDKLVNLFLAKIVDEQVNGDDLKFGWKGVAHDNYFDLVDRLQKLYQQGMQKFLNEHVTYVSEEDVQSAFRLRKDAAKDAVLNYFRELKYFSNNDFTFLDVYNEQLFYQNSQILLEMVKMLQDVKLKTERKNQFLGDLFEGFLDNGVKQSEGQFFTPLPIVKFIVSSLPIEVINKQNTVPKVIDFASGAGHFLNEYADEIKQYVPEEHLAEYYHEVFGIEKEYRLSKVAKVSAFMYGQDDIQIIYGDALQNHPRVQEGTFDVIIANPPYSVKGFLETLTDNDRAKFKLTKYVDKYDTNSSIELFFIERAIQLLKPNGVAGIILPNSVLTNGKLYSRARKLILEEFNIIAVTEFGSKTFGSTGTNTITLFLQKKAYPPKESDDIRYSVERWFGMTESTDYDQELAQRYVEYIGISFEEYKSFLFEDGYDTDTEIEIFVEYKEDFEKSTAAKRINKKKIRDKYTTYDKQSELRKAFSDFVQSRELQKMYFFGLASNQKQDVLIVKSPTDNEEKKAFLGYEWSKRKGQEGIKYVGVMMDDDEFEVSKTQAISGIQTPLFNPQNLEDDSKINSLIRNRFENKNTEIDDEVAGYVNSMSLLSMLDFKSVDFDAILYTEEQTPISFNTKFPLSKMNKIEDLVVLKGQTITQENAITGDVKVVAGGQNFAYYHNEANRTGDVITVSASGANAGFVNYWDEPIFASDAITIQSETDAVITKYIYYLLKSVQTQIFGKARGQAQPHVYPETIGKIEIPVADKTIQTEIVRRMDELQYNKDATLSSMNELRSKIEDVFSELKKNTRARIKLGTIGEPKMTRRVMNNQTSSVGDIPFYTIKTLGGEAKSYISKVLFEEYRNKYPYPKKGSILISAAGTVGKTVRFDGQDAYFQDSNIVWLDNDESVVSNDFLNVMLPFADWNTTDGNTIKRLYNNDIETTEIPLPSKIEQEEIVRKINDLQEILEGMQEKLDEISDDMDITLNELLN